MTKDLVLANAMLVLPDEVIRGSLTARHGVITQIDSGGRVPKGAIDCNGATLSAGLIELHTDNLERHMRPRPGVNWPRRAAIVAHDRDVAATGITTVFDAIRLGSIRSKHPARFGRYGRDAADQLLALRDEGRLKISHHIHLRAEICSETLCEELAAFGPQDDVGLISLMDHTPGQRQFRDLAKFEDYVCTKNNLPREDFADYIDFLIDLQDRLGAKHEAFALDMAKRFGAILASHDDTTPEHVKHNHANGVTLAEFPTTLEAAQTCHKLGTATIMGAPNLVRGGSHSGNIAALDLAEAGLLDILSSDYAPSSLLLGAVQLGALWGNLARGMATVTASPARHANLQDRGTIMIGKRADLCLFEVEQEIPFVTSVWSKGQRVS